uniref:Uncharacterized protein n=1 Tax=Anguilla anguilla TaxID=7936 RepID=A0A0E9S2J8_ANGAN
MAGIAMEIHKSNTVVKNISLAGSCTVPSDLHNPIHKEAVPHASGTVSVEKHRVFPLVDDVAQDVRL